MVTLLSLTPSAGELALVDEDYSGTGLINSHLPQELASPTAILNS